MGEFNPLVRDVQLLLKEKGFDVAVDGLIGPGTLNAVLKALGGPIPAAPPAPIATATELADPGAFFAHMRTLNVLGPDLTQSEVDGCNAIIGACGKAGFSIGYVAYCLATAYHETNGTMQPIHELGGAAYFTRLYDVTGSQPDRARKMGNTAPGDGVRYCGRGLVQLTWKSNYAKATAKLRQLGLIGDDVDMVANPDLAMRPDIAAAIMVVGMREGWFTGRDLDDDIPSDRPATLEEFVRSRDIINGTDKAGAIAAEAVAFENGLLAGRWRAA
ncbi:MAG: putative chitinase [Sphingomonadales bacterium]|nr:putative chitinase [Sphingomonadales bacterium]